MPPEGNPGPQKILFLMALVATSVILLAALLIPGELPFRGSPEPLPSPELPPSWRTDNLQIREIISRVNESELRRTTSDLEGFSTRTFGSEGNFGAGTYLHERLSAIPGLSVRYQDDRFHNVIATLPGMGPGADEAVIVGAHYDSVSTDPGHAPGATDNACGVAIVLEQARILSRYRFNRTLVFAFWNAEETGLEGSGSFAGEATLRQMKIPLYLNYDSSCYDPSNRMVIDLMYGRDARDVAALIVQDNALYGINATLTSNMHSCDGDHIPFRLSGHPVIMTHSESHGPGHTPGDTLDKASFAYAGENARLGSALLARVAGIEATGASPS